MNKKNIKNLIIPIFISALPVITFAANYTLLEPLSKTQTTTVTDPMTYITSLYWYILGLTVALSVLMIIIGGLEYTLTWASESNKGAAKKRIEDAITGLIIALTSYLLLYTINPNLVSFEMEKAGAVCKKTSTQTTTKSTTVSGSTSGGGAVSKPETVGSEGQIPAGAQVGPSGELLYQ